MKFVRQHNTGRVTVNGEHVLTKVEGDIIGLGQAGGLRVSLVPFPGAKAIVFTCTEKGVRSMNINGSIFRAAYRGLENILMRLEGKATHSEPWYWQLGTGDLVRYVGEEVANDSGNSQMVR